MKSFSRNTFLCCLCTKAYFQDKHSLLCIFRCLRVSDTECSLIGMDWLSWVASTFFFCLWDLLHFLKDILKKMSCKQCHGRVCGWISTVCLHEQMLNNLTAWRHWTAQWVLLCWAEMSLLLCLLLWGILVLQCCFSSVVCDLASVVSVWNPVFCQMQK